MDYSALYRRLRPAAFRDVVAQEHIIRTLTNQLRSGRLGHAYLFTGTRGTGKTTVAKIFAKAVNCENGNQGDVCGHCDFCRLNEGELSSVIYEIDAASSTGVDSVRDLKSEIEYLPPYGRFRVYIIDEVHMMSTSAFNALLKTLEEPPAHVIFILATTEPQKIPATIHSRCQRFDFKRIGMDAMTAALAGYMKDEGVDINGDALRYVARVSDGAMRDALTILERCISFYYGEEITLKKVMETLGAVSDDILFELTAALYSGDSAGVLSLIDQAAADGRDMAFLTEELTRHMRSLILSKSGRTGEDRRADEQAAAIDLASLFAYVGAFSELTQTMRGAANLKLRLEICFIRLCKTGSAGETDILMRLEALEHKLAANLMPNAPSPALAPELSARLDKLEKMMKEAPKTIQTQTETHDKKPVLKPAMPGEVKEIVKSFPSKVAGCADAPLRGFLKKTQPAHDGDTLYILCDSPINCDLLKKQEQDVLRIIAPGYSLPVIFTTKDDYQNRHKRRYGEPDAFEDESYEELRKFFGM